MSRNLTEVQVDTLPTCDFCSEPAHYDGATRFGPWAYMCNAHFREHGHGLGTGVGQHLITTSAAAAAEE